MIKRSIANESTAADEPHFSVGSEPLYQNHPAWEEVEAGRFMPRRVRGSFPGRALG
jgi:hypothetical protein